MQQTSAESRRTKFSVRSLLLEPLRTSPADRNKRAAEMFVLSAASGELFRGFLSLATTNGPTTTWSGEVRFGPREAQARRTLVSMLVLDVDRPKEINDVHGHLAGAEAVRKVGHIIGNGLDGSAVACRYGGDEFAILLSESDADGRDC
jgi:hypothetical protein